MWSLLPMLSVITHLVIFAWGSPWTEVGRRCSCSWCRSLWCSSLPGCRCPRCRLDLRARFTMSLSLDKIFDTRWQNRYVGLEMQNSKLICSLWQNVDQKKICSKAIREHQAQDVPVGRNKNPNFPHFWTKTNQHHICDFIIEITKEIVSWICKFQHQKKEHKLNQQLKNGEQGQL